MTDFQHDWVACFDCLSLFFRGHADTKGVCSAAPPGRPGHLGDAFIYWIEYRTPDAAGPLDRPHAQSNWRNCWKCQVMFYNGHPENKGSCAAGGAHDGHVDDGAWNFVIQHGIQYDERFNLNNFRNCWKCQALFYDGVARKVVCPADGRGHHGHADAGTFNFVLSHSGPALIE